MKYALVQLKNGYNTRILCDFLLVDKENNQLTLWAEKGQVGLFQMDQIDFFCLTTKKENKDDKN